MKSELDKLRMRWYRWLGAKTRIDRDVWVELLSSAYKGWAYGVFLRAGWEKGYQQLPTASLQHEVYLYFRDAIAEANLEELKRLDRIVLQELIENKR